MTRRLSPNQASLLRHLDAGGQEADWEIHRDAKVNHALAYYAREKVIKSLIRRGLIVYGEGLTDAGRAALQELN
jgi:hypothetical protein